MKITRIANKSIEMPPTLPTKTKPSDVKPLIDQLDKSVLPGVKNTFKGPGKQSISDFVADLANISGDPSKLNKVKTKLDNLGNKLDTKNK